MSPGLPPLSWLLPMQAPRRLASMAMLAALALIGGCSDGPYERKQGRWHYDDRPIEAPVGRGFQPLSGPFARDAQSAWCRGQPIEGSHGPSFEPLDGRHARDQGRAYFCDTYRKGQEYYLVKHTRIVVLPEADPARLRLLTEGYARDDSRLFHEGEPVPVRDIDSFEILTEGYQRDRVTGYHRNRPIAGSDGASFEVIGAGYTRDRATVWYTHHRSTDAQLQGRTVPVPGAQPAAFVAQAGGYAADGRQAYHQGRVLSRDPQEVRSLEVLGSLYARTSGAVYFDGQRMPGADPRSFSTLESTTEGIDARDARRGYRHGKPVGPAPATPASERR